VKTCSRKIAATPPPRCSRLFSVRVVASSASAPLSLPRVADLLALLDEQHRRVLAALARRSVAAAAAATRVAASQDARAQRLRH
jgi:hypothetical protein